jgi:hypothetical protein
MSLKYITWGLAVLALAACDRPAPAPVADAPSAASEAAAAPAMQPPPVVLTEDPAQRQAYQAMEDGFANDPLAQWAATAVTGATLGEQGGNTLVSLPESDPAQTVGQADGIFWRNSHVDQGVDWLQFGFNRPVNATEIRIALTGLASIRSLTRVDAIDDNGEVQSIWAGQSLAVEDNRGPRTWVIHRFEATPFKVSGVRLTFGNGVFAGLKWVDAVQLVGQP